MPAVVQYKQVGSTNSLRDDRQGMNNPGGDLNKSIALSNRLWLLAFLCVLAATGWLMISLGKQETRMNQQPKPAIRQPSSASHPLPAKSSTD